MFNSRIKNRFRRAKNSRIYQGDIYKDVSFIIGSPIKEKEKDYFELPYLVVLSQDCDLRWDFSERTLKKNQDKYLPTVLICPAYKIEEFAQGEHVKGWSMRKIDSGIIEKIKKNDELKRYHYLQGDDNLLIPDLILDFKHFFTISRDFLYSKKKTNYVASMSELFREELLQRFSNYISRIGLPELS